MLQERWILTDTVRPIPAWLARRMRINEEIRKTVVFLGIIDSQGAFVPFGTGFVALWPESAGYYVYLVTAKHVLADIKRSNRPPVVRINGKDGTVKLGTISPLEEWCIHPTEKLCDIAVISLAASTDTFDYKGIDLTVDVLTPEYVASHEVGPGDQVVTAGLLTRHFGMTKNIPVVRSGNIATMPDEPIDLGVFGHQEVYLIESRSIGGLSGSPVFLGPTAARKHGGAIHLGGSPELLLGVNIGLFEVQIASDAAQTDEAERRAQFLETMSAGIAIVVPAQRVIEIVKDHPALVEQRKKTDEQRRAISGFVLSSGVQSGGVSPLASDENPTHREDFTSLLSAAAKTKSQAD